MIVTVAMESRGADAARGPIARAKPTYTSLIDRDHLVADLYNMLNVPQAVWIDEQGLTVRPTETPGAAITWNLGKITQLQRQADKSEEAGDYAGALAAYKGLVEAVKSAGVAPPTETDQHKELKKPKAPILKRLSAAALAAPEVGKKLSGLARTALTHEKSGDLDAAQATYAKLDVVLKKAEEILAARAGKTAQEDPAQAVAPRGRCARGTRRAACAPSPGGPRARAARSGAARARRRVGAPRTAARGRGSRSSRRIVGATGWSLRASGDLRSLGGRRADRSET